MPALDYQHAAERMGIPIRRPLRVVPDPAPQPEPKAASLRPGTILDVIGQETVRMRLMPRLASARKRGQVAPHCLFYGPPGLGKTTMAKVISTYMGTNLVETTGMALDSPKVLARTLVELKPGDVLFIDEIHTLTKRVSNCMLKVMEDFVLHYSAGRGKDLRMVETELEPFTVVGATTEAGNILDPLRERFKFREELDWYTDEEIARILLRAAPTLNPPVRIAEDAAALLATRCRQTPRTAIEVLEMVRDLAESLTDDELGEIDLETVEFALEYNGIDCLGLREPDIQVLRALCDPHTFNGGPVGVHTLAATTGKFVWTITDMIEPWLLRSGLIVRQNHKGRIATEKAYGHLRATQPDLRNIVTPLDLRWRLEG